MLSALLNVDFKMPIATNALSTSSSANMPYALNAAMSAFFQIICNKCSQPIFKLIDNARFNKIGFNRPKYNYFGYPSPF